MTILLCVLPQAAGKQFRAPMGVPVRLLCELKARIKEKSTSLPYLQGHYSNTGLPPLFIISGRRQRRHDDSSLFAMHLFQYLHLQHNARRQPLEVAGARDERTLFPVGCTPFIGIQSCFQ